MPDNSFDVVSKIDLAEVSNAVQQAMKEIIQRYDLKDSKSNIELKEKDLKLILASQDEYKLKAISEILGQKLVKRQVPLKGLSYGTVTPAAGPARESCLLCHPHPLYGGTMHNKVVYRMARGMRRSGSVVLRFNFRGVGRSEGSHDQGAGELEDARLLLQWLRSRYPALPYSVAGFSFGSRIALRLGCSVEGVRRIIAVGFPTKSANVEYLKNCLTPKVF